MEGGEGQRDGGTEGRRDGGTEGAERGGAVFSFVYFSKSVSNPFPFTTLESDL